VAARPRTFEKRPIVQKTNRKKLVIRNEQQGYRLDVFTLPYPQSVTKSVAGKMGNWGGGGGRARVE
jgi:hypothetical protein